MESQPGYEVEVTGQLLMLSRSWWNQSSIVSQPPVVCRQRKGKVYVLESLELLIVL